MPPKLPRTSGEEFIATDRRLLKLEGEPDANRLPVPAR